MSDTRASYHLHFYVFAHADPAYDATVGLKRFYSAAFEMQDNSTLHAHAYGIYCGFFCMAVTIENHAPPLLDDRFFERARYETTAEFEGVNAVLDAAKQMLYARHEIDLNFVRFEDVTKITGVDIFPAGTPFLVKEHSYTLVPSAEDVQKQIDFLRAVM